MIGRVVRNTAFTIVFLLLITACGNTPEPIHYGFDNCEHCRMLVSDENFGAELITQKGKIFKFDSIECMAAFSDGMNKQDIHSMWVTGFGHPDKLINATSALFLKSAKLKSPMGLNLSAFSDENELSKIRNEYGGERISWEGITVLVKNEWK